MCTSRSVEFLIDHLPRTVQVALAGRSDPPLKFALLLAFGLASTGALDAFFCPAATGALSLLTVYVLASGSVLRLYVLFRHLIPAPAVPYSLPPYLVSGSRSRPPRRGHAGGSAKAHA